MSSSKVASGVLLAFVAQACAPPRARRADSVSEPAEQRPATVPVDAGPPAQVAIVWSFPGLLQTSLGPTFPTYLAHLFGKHPQHPLVLSTVCAAVKNPRSTPLRARLKVDLPAFAESATQDVTVDAGQASTTCLDPAFDLDRLYALRDTTPGRLEASITDLDAGDELATTMKPISVAAADEIAWQADGASAGDMRDLSAVFVTPEDPQIDALQRAAQESSLWKSFGEGDPYQRPPLARQDSINAEEYVYESVMLEPGESVSWELTSIDEGTVDVYLFTPDQFAAWQNGTGTAAVQAWTGQVSGAKGMIAPPAGSYVFAVYNPGTDFAARQVVYTRNNTREDVAADVLGAIYAALATMDTRYSNIPASYFAGWQHVRRPREALAALSANCLEGALLVASVLELVGMEPVLFVTSTHAYVGVRSAPGSPVIWPVETTLIDTAAFDEALQTGIEELAADQQKDPQLRVIDVKAMRARGILPLPE